MKSTGFESSRFIVGDYVTWQNKYYGTVVKIHDEKTVVINWDTGRKGVTFAPSQSEHLQKVCEFNEDDEITKPGWVGETPPSRISTKDLPRVID